MTCAARGRESSSLLLPWLLPGAAQTRRCCRPLDSAACPPPPVASAACGEHCGPSSRRAALVWLAWQRALL